MRFSTVADALDWARMKPSEVRIRLHYGDAATGRDWLEEWDVTGYVEQSMGPQRVPILIANNRSRGGGAILTNCIVRIRLAKGGQTIYSHPTYHYGCVEFAEGAKDLTGQWRYRVLVNGEEHAAFETKEKRTRWMKKMGLKEAVEVFVAAVAG